MAPTSTERQNTPDSWQNLAKMVGKSVDEVKRHYEILKEDIERIESGQVPLPYFHNRTAVTPKSNVNKQSRL